MTDKREEVDLNDELDDQIDDFEDEFDDDVNESSMTSWDDEIDEIDEIDEVVSIHNEEPSLEDADTSKENVDKKDNGLKTLLLAAGVGVLGAGGYFVYDGMQSSPTTLEQIDQNHSNLIPNEFEQRLDIQDTQNKSFNQLQEEQLSTQIEEVGSKNEDLILLISELESKIEELEKNNHTLSNKVNEISNHARKIDDVSRTNQNINTSIATQDRKINDLDDRLTEVEKLIHSFEKENATTVIEKDPNKFWKDQTLVSMDKIPFDGINPIIDNRWRLKGYQIVSWNDDASQVLMRTSTGKTFTFKVGENIVSPIYGTHRVNAILEGGKKMLVGDKYIVDTHFVNLPESTISKSIPVERSAMKAAGFDSPESYRQSVQRTTQPVAEKVVKTEVIKGYVVVGIGPNGVIVKTDNSEQPFILVKHGTHIPGFGVVTKVGNKGVLESGNKIIQSNIK